MIEMKTRGRPRKYRWYSIRDLETNYSPNAQYIKWASANNVALQTVAAVGCPKCNNGNVELRHDKEYKIIRFHCLHCSHETSYRIKMPKPGSFSVIPEFEGGVRIGEKVVDFYHPKTKRQRIDAQVLRFSNRVESGRISLGGEWHIDGVVGGLNDQKRYYSSFKEVEQLCRWNEMQREHEKRLRELEKALV